MTPGLPLALILGHPLGLTLGLPLGLTPGLSFGPHPCYSLCLGREPKARVATKVLNSSIPNEDCDDFLCWNSSCSKISGYCCNETLHCLLIENSLGASRMVDIFAE